MAKYSKFIIAIIGGVITALLSYYGNDVPTWLTTLIPLLTAAGVYRVPNEG